MLSWRQIWLPGSFARAILVVALALAILPIAIFGTLSVVQSADALTRQTQDSMQMIAEARASAIDGKLKDALHLTQVAAVQAGALLEEPVAPADLAARAARYQPDARNILGLDVYYTASGGAASLGSGLSNVYWDNRRPAGEAVLRQIVQTEELDTTFASIKAISPDTQWIYLTTSDGMMRLYPWASNDAYPAGWDPREILFYTVAAPEVNPDQEPRWTTPYVDFAGAGWMVTVSVPVHDQAGQFRGIMSHDITTASLNQIAFDLNVLDGAGYGFLIDQYGRVIVHPSYQPHDAKKGTAEETSLLTEGSPSFRALIQRMVDGERGYGYFSEPGGGEQLLAFAPVSETGWSLGVVVPRTRVLAPATDTRNRALLIGAIVLVVACGMALLLARRVYQPLQQLLAGVQQVSDDHAAQASAGVRGASFSELERLALAFDEMARKVAARESRLKAKVALFSIEIDQRQQQAQLEAVTETDYFQRLEQNAERLRGSLRHSEAAAESPQALGTVSVHDDRQEGGL